jgi:simple sugar transport system ATP-binding protein
LPVDPQAKIWQLSVGEQQRVEIIKTLYRGAQVLVLDEPTAVLTPQECETLFRTLRKMTDEGKTIVFISHKLEEVLSIAQRVSVLRSGRMVATTEARGKTKAELASMMVGRQVLFQLEKPPTSVGETRLLLQDIEALDDKFLPSLRKISLEVRSGEILGIAGVAGNGQRELAEVICGLRSITAGRIRVANQDVRASSPKTMIAAGVAYVPEDRNATGSSPNLSIADNLALKAYRTPAHGRGGLIDGKSVEARAKTLIEEFSIATPGTSTPARKLSGGNLQKVILAREIASQPNVLVAASPTRGLDIGATENVRRILLKERSHGAAILLLSEDLDEIFSISDRIAVIYEGQIMGVFAREDADLTTIGLLMAGGEHPAHVVPGANEKEAV